MAAIDEFRAAVDVFGAGANIGLPAPSSMFGDDLANLKKWAEESLATTTGGGRPDNEHVNTLVRDLLLLYWHGFGQKPSCAHNGPTVRFIDFFLTPIRSWDWIGVCRYVTAVPPPFDRGLDVSIPTRDAIPETIRTTLPQITETAIPSWWWNLGLKQPSFPD
jgi:hypothetical protein